MYIVCMYRLIQLFYNNYGVWLYVLLSVLSYIVICCYIKWNLEVNLTKRQKGVRNHSMHDFSSLGFFEAVYRY